MTAKSYGLLALVAGATLLLSHVLPPTTVDAMTISNSTLARRNVSIYDIPTQLDEDDLLMEYGKFMLSIMNQSVNPCEDFYEYACGNWKNAEMLPEHARNDTFLHTIQVRINEMMGEFLRNTTATSNTTMESGANDTAETKAKKFYSTCVKQYGDNARGYKEFMQLKDYQGNATDWIDINFISKHGMYPLLPLKVSYSPESRKFEVLLSLPQKVLGNADIVDMKNLTVDFKLDSNDTRQALTAELEELILFEQNLTSHAQKRNETESLTLAEFLSQHKQDQLNWTRYFEVAFNGTAKKSWIINSQYEDFAAIERYLRKTPPATLRNYVKWRTLLKFYYTWKAEVRDKTAASACREHTEQYFNYALIPWFIDIAYDADRRADILLLAKSIKSSFYDLIDRYSWLDDDTKSGAKTKLQSMDVLVGYSDEMRHRDVINRVYNDVNMTDSWFENLLTLEANRARVRLRSVDKAAIPPLMSTRDVNAYYADFLNLVFVTVGIAQLPFYHIKFPPSLKFGGIGNILGHEMAHGFDSYCYKFNYDGKKQNWWSEASLRNFRERYRCLESQYNKYIYQGVQTNGSLTSGDNIADNVGTRISYYAYLESAGKKDGDKKPLPGMDFTNKQLYFLKFAQSSCTGRDTDYKVRKMKSDVHAYEEFRVGGTLSNMPEFSEVFKCKLGTDMNPLKKCVVW